MTATGAAPARGPWSPRALLAAAHPGPSIAVTGLTTALSVAFGNSPSTSATVALAVLTGQLSIGWANDAIDSARDRKAVRRDKPVAQGALDARTVWIAAVLAAAACVPLSLATGPAAGAAHLLAVGGGWAYDLGLKRTRWSWLPYAWSFGLLPVFTGLAGGASGPPTSVIASAAVLGTAAHLFNGLPDIDEDRAAGLRPLPVALGPTATRWLGAALLAVPGSLLAAQAGAHARWAWTPAGATVVLAALAAALGTGGPSANRWRAELPFVLVVLAAAVDVTLLLVLLPR